MGQNSKRPGKAVRRKEDVALKLLAVGGAFVALPWLLGSSPQAQVFRSLVPVGALMLLAGGFLLWRQRRKAEPPPTPLFQAASTLSGARSRPVPLRQGSEAATGPDSQREGNYRRPTCMKCGLEMMKRQPRKHERPFWVCAASPRCPTRMAMPRT